jgi:AraC-like DNA-binding protein
MQISVNQTAHPYLKVFIECYFFLEKKEEAVCSYVSYPNTNYTFSFYKGSSVWQDETSAIIQPALQPSSCFYPIHANPFETKLYGRVEEYAIVFKPFALKKLVKGHFEMHPQLLPEDLLGNCDALKDQLFSNKSKAEKIKILDRFLSALFLKNDVITPLEMQYLQGSGSIGIAANDFGINRKKLYRSFESHLHLSPKDYFKIKRFRQALDAISSQPLAKLTHLAIDTGYFDQSHMIREFKQLSWQTPSALNKSVKAIDNHLLWNFI